MGAKTATERKIKENVDWFQNVDYVVKRKDT